MISKSNRYFINILLAVFSWFFLVEPWFAFSSSEHESLKTAYNDASKPNTFDSVAYFQISKDDDTDDITHKHTNFVIDNFVETVISVFNHNIVFKFFSFQKSYNKYSLKLYILNSVIRI